MPQPSNGKILVVDAQIEMVRLLADQLADEGYAVEPAGTFAFGLHARVELTLLRLLTSEIGLLERAIQGDVTPSSPR